MWDWTARKAILLQASVRRWSWDSIAVAGMLLTTRAYYQKQMADKSGWASRHNTERESRQGWKWNEKEPWQQRLWTESSVDFRRALNDACPCRLQSAPQLAPSPPLLPRTPSSSPTRPFHPWEDYFWRQKCLSFFNISREITNFQHPLTPVSILSYGTFDDSLLICCLFSPTPGVKPILNSRCSGNNTHFI